MTPQDMAMGYRAPAAAPPTFTSFTMNVPPDVPSLTHSSAPFARSFAWKYSLPLLVATYAFVIPLAAPAAMSATMYVPLLVASVAHSSSPFDAVFALKNNCDPTALK